MASSFYGIHMASRAMQAFQQALLTTSHNMANVNTPGYSRQVARFAEGPAYFEPGVRSFYVGGGADVVGITRVRDLFLQQRYFETTRDYTRYSNLRNNLRLAETAFGELTSESGLSTQLDKFFNAFQELSVDPANTGLRTSVRQAADSLARRFRSLSSDLSSLEANTRASVSGKISELNQLAAQVAELNKRIVQAETTGATPNDLYDQRDQVIARMSELADVRTNIMPNGTMQVFLEQHTLVDQVGANALPDDIDVATGSIVVNGRNIRVGSGALAGDFEALQQISGYKQSLDTLATEIINEVNSLHSGGYTLDGRTGINLFQGSDAASFDLSDEVKADAGNIVAAGTDVDGDGSVAAAIAALQYASHANLGDRSFGEFYSDLVLQVGSDVSAAGAAAEAQSAIRQQITSQLEANAGVNLDEEMANMIQYQRTYEAAARVFSILDSVLEETILMLGR